MKDYQTAYEHTKLQAQIWKQEARCANDTIAKIYQLCTGGKGEPGNWNGAEPVRALIAKLTQGRPRLHMPDDIVVVHNLDSDEAGDYRLARHGDVVNDPQWQITDIDPKDLD